MNIILAIGIAQGLFLVLLLIGKKENHNANMILASIIFLYSLFIGQVLAMNLALYNVVPHIFGITIGLPLLFGPLHYLYVRTLILETHKVSFKDIVHFIPYFINWAVFLPILFKNSAELSHLIKDYYTELPRFYLHFGLWAITIQGLIYMGISLKIIKLYSLKIKDQYSSLDKINLNWLKNITIGTLLVWIVVFLKNLLSYFNPVLFNQGEIIVAFGVSVLIYVMGYLGLMQTEIFNTTSLKNDNHNIEKTNIDEISLKKYEKSGLSDEKAKKSLDELLKLMVEDKLYKDNNLTLKNLAKKLSISSHNLSEIINTYQKQSFFDFINSYRVKDVQEAMMLPQKESYTLLALALEAGFNSKSSFNAIFKKHTNMTPSQYRKQKMLNI